jgi:hypothetical protein
VPGLDSLFENSWDLGMYQAGAQQLEPEGTAQTITGLIGDDGLPYRRGGVAYKSSAVGGTTGLKAVWSGHMPPGLRTVVISNDDLVIVAADDTTVLNTGTSLTWQPTRIVLAGGMLTAVSTNSNTEIVYGGSMKASNYGTGTVTLTSGSTTVTGSGTSWTTNADAGMLFFDSATSTYGLVARINNNTSLTLAQPWAGSSGAGRAYLLYVVGPFGASLSGIVASVTRYRTSVVNRLAVATDWPDPRVYFSAINSPNTFAVDDYHSFPAPVVGLAAMRDTLMVFTESGVYAISNMGFDLTDAQGNPQQRLELVNPDLIAWGHEGIAGWKGALIAPALDGVWLIDGVSAPVRISDRIADLYLGYVRTSGYKPGVAEVFNSHYFLPILNSSNAWVDTLVCRLEPTHNGTAFGWSQPSGFGAKVTAYAERPSSPPVLLGASAQTSSRVLDCTGYFSPAAAVKNDADATTHPFQLVTRNIPTGGNVKNRVDYLKVKYLLTADGGDAPRMTMEANPDGAGWQTLTLGGGTPTAGPNDGYTEVYWNVRLAARFIRFRLTLTAATAIQVKPSSIQVFIFKSGRYGN